MRSLAITFFVAHLLTADISTAQTSIVVDTIIQTSFCAGGSVVIPYSLPNGDFNFGNIFTAQMSEVQDLLCLFGDFGNPIEIGILPYWSGGYILGEVPDSITLGTYRIRVVSSNPPDTSNVSPNCLLITNLPQIVFTITGTPSTDTLCAADSVELSVLPLPASYLWSTGETTPTIWINSSGSYTVTARDTVGCETTSEPYNVVFENCVGLDEYEKEQNHLRAYPIPADDRLEINFETRTMGNIEVHLFNLLGKILVSEYFSSIVGDNHFSLAIGSLPEGLYLLKVSNESDCETITFIKN